MKVTYSRNGQDFSVETADLPEASIAYLLAYGWKQSLQDCIAGPVAKAKADGDSEAEIENLIIGTIGKRMDAIKAGTVGIREQAVRDPFATMVKKVLNETLAAWAKAKGKKLPKADSDDYKKLAEAVMEKKGEVIKTEARKRLDAASTVGLEDLDLD